MVGQNAFLYGAFFTAFLQPHAPLRHAATRNDKAYL